MLKWGWGGNLKNLAVLGEKNKLVAKECYGNLETPAFAVDTNHNLSSLALLRHSSQPYAYLFIVYYLVCCSKRA